MTAKEKEFVHKVKSFYTNHGRHSLPWRKTHDPYHILISELMLQQTQVSRVQKKYPNFIAMYPDVRSLAHAPLSHVLMAWQGLGYNRRAKMLHLSAKQIVDEHNGHVPKTYNDLVALPGIGTYTAGAIMVFAYNVPVSIVETNIRNAYLHHFFKNKKAVSDKEILMLVEKTLPERNVKDWYGALMDYGSYLKMTYGNQNVRSRHYAKQGKFKGSNRQIRGAIVRTLANSSCDLGELALEANVSKKSTIKQLERLITEGLLTKSKGRYSLLE